MAKGKCPDCPKCLPGWLVQFGDLMSLLLTFFILLLSMAVMDKKKVEEYFDVMKKAMGFIEGSTDIREQTDQYSDKQADNGDGDADGTESDADEAAQEVEEIMQEFNETVAEESERMNISLGKNEFTLDIPSVIMFDDGEYKLTKKDAKRFIAKLSRIIRTMPQTFDIEIIGHTDRSSYRSTEIPRDNWDVSALRSISVVEELIKNRIDPAQLKVSAYASYRPKSESAAQNRRVEMRFVAQESKKDLFEEESFFDRLEG